MIKTPFLSVDAIVINDQHEILLIERKNKPHGWALPGGFVDIGESVENAVSRELKEETGIDLTGLQLFKVYSNPQRDPRFHVVSIVLFFPSYINKSSNIIAGDDAKNVSWHPIHLLDKLEIAFDHKTIIEEFLEDNSFVLNE